MESDSSLWSVELEPSSIAFARAVFGELHGAAAPPPPQRLLPQPSPKPATRVSPSRTWPGPRRGLNFADESNEQSDEADKSLHTTWQAYRGAAALPQVPVLPVKPWVFPKAPSPEAPSAAADAVGADNDDGSHAPPASRVAGDVDDDVDFDNNGDGHGDGDSQHDAKGIDDWEPSGTVTSAASTRTATVDVAADDDDDEFEDISARYRTALLQTQSTPKLPLGSTIPVTEMLQASSIHQLVQSVAADQLRVAAQAAAQAREQEAERKAWLASVMEGEPERGRSDFERLQQQRQLTEQIAHARDIAAQAKATLSAMRVAAAQAQRAAGISNRATLGTESLPLMLERARKLAEHARLAARDTEENIQLMRAGVPLTAIDQVSRTEAPRY